jgi:8-oxo-dGTP diphosphatase
LVLAIYLVAMVSTFRKVDRASHSNSDTLIGFALPFIAITLLLILICYKKGEAPKWQWGESDHAKVGTGVMIWKDGKVLLGKRKNSFGSGEYSFPGGHLEYKESFEECVRREVVEECGLEIKNIKFVYVGNSLAYAPRHYVTVGFSADWVSGEPKVLEPEKCESWGWYTVDNLPSPMFELSKILIDCYKNGKNFYDIEK